jgi:monofunctional chorismate mutase
MSRIHPVPRTVSATAGGGVTVAAVRGAISVRANRATDIREATARLLDALIQRNAVTPERVVSAVFTATPDLTADFPAHAARRLGWTDVPLLGAVELGVPGAPRRIVRVLLTLRDVPRGTRLVPVYLDEAAALRPDLSEQPTVAARPRGGRTRRIAIVGLGQIGGSIGLALEDAGGWHRVGFDTRARARRDALARGVVDEAARSLAAACSDAQLAVVCVPVDVLPRVLAQVAAALPAGAALLDTGSARGAGVTAALIRASARVRAVGGHPIAGNEHRGLEGARAQLFQGAPFALLPVSGSVPPIIRALLHDLGADPRVVTPSRHDQALARTSHLPWLVSRALARLGARAANAHLAGPGFASMTRLAASDPRIARAYARANASNVRAAWRALRTRLDRDIAALE